MKNFTLLEKVSIGGSDQWILSRSESTDNPLILYVHGGPGTSQMSLNKKNTRNLEKHFILVDWDQRGAGKSYKAIKDKTKMNIGQFVEDIHELTLYLIKKYRKERIVLAGHSWGSVIGLLAASKYPDLYYCYVGIGQLVKMNEGEMASYQWTLEQARKMKDKKAIRALEQMGPPPYKDNWQANTIKQRKLLGKYGGEFYGSRIGAFGVVIKSLLFSREYNFMDRINFFRGIMGSMKFLWPQLFEVDFFQSLPESKLPVFFMEGRHDMEVPSPIAARYFEMLTAPSKEIIWFENSAHMPNSEEKELFNRVMVEKILPVCVKQTGA